MNDRKQRALEALQRAADGSNDDSTLTARMIAALANFFGRELAVLDGQIADLQANLFAYEGSHEIGKVYDRGMFTTLDGVVWKCIYKTASRPGDGPAWSLDVAQRKDAQ